MHRRNERREMNRRNATLFSLFVLCSLVMILKLGTGIDFADAEPALPPLGVITPSKMMNMPSKPLVGKKKATFTRGQHSDRYISSSSLSWAPQLVTPDMTEQQLVIAVGIPSTDTSVGAMRRKWQRESWLKYHAVWPNPASRSSSSSSLPTRLVVNYLVGLHPLSSYQFSAGLRDESDLHGDIIGLNLKEGKSTGKISGGAGYWGLEAEVGMSKKALIWYRIALEQFPNADFVMKADDDIFLRVPLYVRDLMKWFAAKGDPSSKFYFVGGMAILMSADLVRVVAADAATEDLLIREYDPTVNYKSHNLDHEDVMIGRILYRLHVNHTLVKDCRMHDVHTGENKKPISHNSLIVHHLKEIEYAKLFSQFADETPLPPVSISRGRTHRGFEKIELC